MARSKVGKVLSDKWRALEGPAFMQHLQKMHKFHKKSRIIERGSKNKSRRKDAKYLREQEKFVPKKFQ